ncbi:MAG TPA: hypothetical protein VK753_02920 [Xanthomonadaceae bacterium]|nr:hypothetical protein [Xanthomonadaceae bacterium]
MPKLPDYLSPAAAIAAASRAHPAFKYATAALGLMGIVAVALHWGLSAYAAVFGSILLVVLMVLFLVFAQATSLARASVTLQAQVLVWTFLSLAIATAILLFTSSFFNQPLPFRTVLLRELMPSGQGDSAINCNLPSQDGGVPTTIQFVNHRARTVELFWIHPDASVEYFQDIAPGQSIEENTFVNHSWCVKDADTKMPVASAIATQAAKSIDIR